ncbi:MAG: sialidase family protein [Bacteroidota bacterium]
MNNPSSTDPEEVSIAINPVNPLNLVAGANLHYYYSSTNGGLTWTQGTLSSTYRVWGDPVVVFDHLGNTYFGHLSNPPSPGYWIDRIVVQKSTDGGLTWNNGVGVGFNPPLRNQDKEWLAADMTLSPWRGNVYMAWTEFDRYNSSSTTDSTRILFSRTTDAGATWSAPVRVSDLGGDCRDGDNTVEGAVPAVGPDGEVYMAWSGPAGIMLDRSTDGGQTFGADVFVAAQPGGWDFNVPGIYRCNGMPVTACDVSGGPYRGQLYVLWSDQRNGLSDTDVFLSRSTDGGLTWDAARRVNNDLTGTHQFFPWMTVDQSNGFLYALFYDRRNSTGNATEVFVARSTDGGETFTNFPVSQSAFTPSAGIFFGDYTNIAAAGGKVYPIWMRLDGSVLSVWTALVSDSAEVTRSYAVEDGWNLLSVPLAAEDMRRAALYPAAASDALAFVPGTGYAARDTLENGAGYWLRFQGDQTAQITGGVRMADTLHVVEGWNMVGCLSEPIPAAGVVQVPSGILEGDFFSYSPAGYATAPVLQPGKGYWVRSNGAGMLILDATVPPAGTDTGGPDRTKPPYTRWH